MNNEGSKVLKGDKAMSSRCYFVWGKKKKKSKSNFHNIEGFSRRKGQKSNCYSKSIKRNIFSLTYKVNTIKILYMHLYYFTYNTFIHDKYAFIKALTWDLSYIGMFTTAQYKWQPEVFKLTWNKIFWSFNAKSAQHKI